MGCLISYAESHGCRAAGLVSFSPRDPCSICFEMYWSTLGAFPCAMLIWMYLVPLIRTYLMWLLADLYVMYWCTSTTCMQHIYHATSLYRTTISLIQDLILRGWKRTPRAWPQCHNNKVKIPHHPLSIVITLLWEARKLEMKSKLMNFCGPLFLYDLLAVLVYFSPDGYFFCISEVNYH